MPPPNTNIGNGTVISLEAGMQNSCVRMVEGLRCWGEGLYSQLGPIEGSLGDEPGELPPAFLPVGNVTDAVVGQSMCSLSNAGQLRCWGAGAWGSHGDGHTQNIGDDQGELPPPLVDVGGLVSQLHQSSFALHHCVVLEDQSVRCWGAGASGALGSGDVDSIGDQPGEMPPPPVDVF